ncbi:Fic family protein [Adhaeretor mobilis]|uniref:Fic/DOC family protein n=1 Tax=Adhaeretor mobilis TaxID=1930276 RepID=A0A517MQ84_9BACT|nr:Fic family protein [Adhaeretor mobilis]QDS97038.1 Fic/DOC family protein [Adhaeretor mobilis]
MPYIHELTDWPALTWDSEILAAPLAAVRHQQGRLLGKMDSLGFDLRNEASLVVLTADVVKSSAIEGATLDPEEVRSSIARKLGLDVAGLPRPSRDVDGVVEMMLNATQKFDEELTGERLWGWHAALFPTGHSGINRIAVGQWRHDEEGPMQVVSGPIGKEKVHFQAPSAERLSEEVKRFLDWFNTPQVGESLTTDPVLVAGLAHFWFVTIHPFEDGNGRIARAIADMALARADGTEQRFYSMSSQIELERKDYYRQLEHAQRGELDVTGWLAWFVDCLGRAIESSDERLSGVLKKARLWQHLNTQTVNERQRLVINRMLNGFEGFLTTSKYTKFAKCSADTALRDIQELLSWGVLLKNPGRGRSTSYRLAEPENIVE